jgi:hypothetical protein
MVLGPLRYAGIFGLAYLIVIAMSGGYLYAFMQAIITASAQGKTDMPTVLASFLSLLGLAVEMRLLGLLYYTNRERLAWF